MNKTPNYTKNAVNKYNSKFDRIAVNLPKGTKEEIKQLTGKSCNAFISLIVITELERIKSKKMEAEEKKRYNNKNQNPSSNLEELQKLLDQRKADVIREKRINNGEFTKVAKEEDEYYNKF